MQRIKLSPTAPREPPPSLMTPRSSKLAQNSVLAARHGLQSCGASTLRQVTQERSIAPESAVAEPTAKGTPRTLKESLGLSETISTSPTGESSVEWSALSPRRWSTSSSASRESQISLESRHPTRHKSRQMAATSAKLAATSAFVGLLNRSRKSQPSYKESCGHDEEHSRLPKDLTVPPILLKAEPSPDASEHLDRVSSLWHTLRVHTFRRKSAQEIDKEFDKLLADHDVAFASGEQVESKEHCQTDGLDALWREYPDLEKLRHPYRKSKMAIE